MSLRTIAADSATIATADWIGGLKQSSLSTSLLAKHEKNSAALLPGQVIAAGTV